MRSIAWWGEVAASVAAVSVADRDGVPGCNIPVMKWRFFAKGRNN